MFETVWQDVRHGARMLAKNPGFSLVAILSIAMGVGANAAMFSIADGLILRPLPVPDADSLLAVSGVTPTGQENANALSYPDFLDLRARVNGLEGLAAADGTIASIAAGRDEAALGRFGLAVSANYFDVLRIRPVLGRTFLAGEDRPGEPHAVVVLAYQTWQEQFGGDPDIVGQEVRLSGQPYTIVGVAPEGFAGTATYVPSAFFVPLSMLPALRPDSQQDFLELRDWRTFSAFGRLKSGATFRQAAQEVELVSQTLRQEHPAFNQGWSFRLRTERDARFAQNPIVVAMSAVLIGLAAAVLLVACANVSGLLASRAPARAREIAVRQALGGGRARLTRQLITETVLLAAAGGVGGLAIAYIGILSFRQFQIATDVGVKFVYELDRRALVVGLVVSVVSAILSSAVPAWRSTRMRDLSQTLRSPVAPASRVSRLWGRHGLVATQIALTLVVLTVAVSFYQAFHTQYDQGPGFRTDHLLLVNIDPGLARYDEREAQQFFDRLSARAAAISGVTSVALTSFVPLSYDGGSSVSVVPEGFTLPAGMSSLSVRAAYIDGAYLDTIGIPIVSGRSIRASDTVNTPRVAVVSRGFAARYWPGEDPLGKRVRLSGSPDDWAQIVGVAEDAKFQLFTATSTPFIYLSRLQTPSIRGTVVVRTAGASSALAAQLRAAVLDSGRDVPILSMRTMEAFYDTNVSNLNRVVVRTIAGLGSMGLVLALIGLYGLTAGVVSRRTREIGIRMALGALPGSVLTMILRQGVLPSVAGILLGVLASVAVGGLIQTGIPGTGGNLVTYLAIVPVIVVVVTIAAYVPARRAAHIDPLAALRQE